MLNLEFPEVSYWQDCLVDTGVMVFISKVILIYTNVWVI